MDDRDPFVVGVQMVLAQRPELKPAPLAKKAGMDDSTMRKLLKGEISSLSVKNAIKVARALDMDLSTIIALGEHSRGPEIVQLAIAIQAAPEDARDHVDGYLRVQAQSRSTPVEHPEAQEADQPKS